MMTKYPFMSDNITHQSVDPHPYSMGHQLKHDLLMAKRHLETAIFWVLLKNPLGGPCGVMPIIFEPYSVH